MAATHGCLPRSQSRAALWADTLPGTSGAREAKRHCAAICRLVFLKESFGWVDRHRILAVFLPAVLPPPIPLLPFALAAGALGVSRRRFLAIYSAARTLRYSVIAWVGVVYGRHAIRVWSAMLQKWSTPLVYVLAGLLVAGTFYGIWKVSGLRKNDAAAKPARHKAATRAS